MVKPHDLFIFFIISSTYLLFLLFFEIVDYYKKEINFHFVPVNKKRGLMKWNLTELSDCNKFLTGQVIVGITLWE